MEHRLTSLQIRVILLPLFTLLLVFILLVIIVVLMSERSEIPSTLAHIEVDKFASLLKDRLNS